MFYQHLSLNNALVIFCSVFLTAIHLNAYHFNKTEFIMYVMEGYASATMTNNKTGLERHNFKTTK